MEDRNTEVVIKRTFPAGIERLWEACTNVEDMLKWWSPVGMTTPHVEAEVRVGGQYAITMEYTDTKEQVTVRGTYKVIERPTKLVFSWQWDGSEQETEVSFQFRSLSDNETELLLIHSGFSLQPTADDVANRRTMADHQGGWTSGFTKLEALVRA